MNLLSTDNLIFLLPLAAAVGLVLLMALGLPFGDDPGIDGVVDAAHGADGLHANLDHHAHLSHTGTFGSALSFLGIGDAPLALILVSLGLLWGVTGLCTGMAWDSASIWSRVSIAAVAAVFGTRWTSKLMARILPSVESYEVSTQALVSEEAEVIHEITPRGGMARLVDRTGSLRDLNCRTEDGSSVAARGEKVILTGYDEATDSFTVRTITTPTATQA